MGLAVEEEEIGHGGAYPRTAGDVAPEEVAWTAWRGVKVPAEVAEDLCATHESERGLGDVIPTAREVVGMGIRGGEVGGAAWRKEGGASEGWWGLGGAGRLGGTPTAARGQPTTGKTSGGARC